MVTTPDERRLSMVLHLDLATVLALLAGTVLPLLTGLVTRWDAHPGTRAVVLLVLSALTSFLAAWLDAVNGHVPFDIGPALFNSLIVFLTGVGTHFGLWKATGAAAAAVRTGGFIGGGGTGLKNAA